MEYIESHLKCIFKAVIARNVFIIQLILSHPIIMKLSVHISRYKWLCPCVYIEFCVRHFLAEISGVLVHRIQMYLSQRNHSGMQMHRSGCAAWSIFIIRPDLKLAYQQQLDLHLSKRQIQMHLMCIIAPATRNWKRLKVAGIMRSNCEQLI